MAERQEIDVKEAIITLTLEFEAMLRILEKKGLLTREEVMNEIFEIKKEEILKRRKN